MSEQNYIISAFVRNHFGVLTRISGLFSRRGYNIRSLTVGETVDPLMSRMTVEFFGDERTLAQIKSQLSKVEDVISIEELPDSSSVRSELFLIKVAVNDETRRKTAEIAASFAATVRSETESAAVYELTGDTVKLSAFLDAMKPYGVLETARTGITAMSV